MAHSKGTSDERHRFADRSDRFGTSQRPGFDFLGFVYDFRFGIVGNVCAQLRKARHCGVLRSNRVCADAQNDEPQGD